MAGPGNEMTTSAASQGPIRATHADREQVVEALKAAFVQGRLDRDEFAQRIGRALGSRTYADLAALTADLPARPVSAPTPEPAQPPRPARKSAKNKKAVVALGGATVALPGIFLLLLMNADGPASRRPRRAGPVPRG
jgi:hypothetical protein